MNEQGVRYARAADGCHLAYRVSGDGPLDLIDVGGYGTLFPLDAADDQPRWRRFEERLGRFCRLIRFDIRGIGLSDPMTEPPTVETWVSDVLAVLDAVGSERSAALGAGFGGLPVIQLAADHPDRISAAILANTGARFVKATDYSVGASRRAAAEMTAAADPDADGAAGDGPNEIDLMAPSIAGDSDAQRWWTRTAARGAGPAVASEIWRFSLRADVRNAATRISVPTLVMGSADNLFIYPEITGWLADNIPDAERCDLPGGDQVIWAIPGDLVSNRIEAFLTGGRSRASGARSIHAILFTDIVDSTASNAASGDEAWVELLARHDNLADRVIGQHAGRLVKRLGDGLLAVFELASDAVDAAAAIAAVGGDLGIGIRTAVHVAEVEEVYDDVLGLGVNVAARVMGHASGGEVLASRAVVELLAGSGHTFSSHGRHELKGVEGEWELFMLDDG